MRTQVRSGGASIPLKKDSNGNDAGSVVSETTLVATELTDPITATLERTATIAAAGVLTTFTDATPYNVCSFVVTVITTSITVEVSNDGTNYEAVNVKDIGDGTFKAVIATGVYELSGKFKSIKFTAVGAGAATAQFLLGVQ